MSSLVYIDIFNEGGGNGKRIDDKAVKEIKEEYKRLQKERREAEENDDTDRLAEIGKRENELKEYRSKNVGINGSPRKKVGPNEQLRVNITNHINKSLEIIEREHSLLWRHLNISINTGSYCEYTPEKLTTWKF